MICAFNTFGATRAVPIHMSKAFERVWQANIVDKLKSSGTSVQVFGLIPSFLSNSRLQVVLDGKSLQEYPLKAPFLVS